MKRKLVPFLIISDNFLYLFQLLLLLSEVSTLIFFSALNSLKTAMLLMTTMASLDLSGKVCYLFWTKKCLSMMSSLPVLSIDSVKSCRGGDHGICREHPSEKDPWSLG
jgi:hypothetical protein